MVVLGGAVIVLAETILKLTVILKLPGKLPYVGVIITDVDKVFSSVPSAIRFTLI